MPAYLPVGDVVSGPDSIIGAISQGRKAAGAMDAYLGGDGGIDEVLATPEKRKIYAATLSAGGKTQK